jgi:limonene-1,2-epoxide hydrolase
MAGETMSNTKIVMDFIEAWNKMDWDAVVAAFSEDVVYHNIPMEVLKGKTDVAQFITTGMDLKSVDWEVLSIAENGNRVLTERIDNFYLTDGKTVSMPVMGTFEIEHGLIKAWRDYFDLATFTSQMAP